MAFTCADVSPRWVARRGLLPLKSCRCPPHPWDTTTVYSGGGVCDMTCSFAFPHIHALRRHRHLFRFARCLHRIRQMKALSVDLSMNPKRTHTPVALLSGNENDAQPGWAAPRVPAIA